MCMLVLVVSLSLIKDTYSWGGVLTGISGLKKGEGKPVLRIIHIHGVGERETKMGFFGKLR